MHTHIQNHYPASIMLWFHKYVNEPSSIENIHLYLIDAYVTHADFEISRYRPKMTSYSCKEEVVSEMTMRKLEISFEKGGVGFAYQKSFYVTSRQPVAPPRD